MCVQCESIKNLGKRYCKFCGAELPQDVIDRINVLAQQVEDGVDPESLALAAAMQRNQAEKAAEAQKAADIKAARLKAIEDEANRIAAIKDSMSPKEKLFLEVAEQILVELQRLNQKSATTGLGLAAGLSAFIAANN